MSIVTLDGGTNNGKISIHIADAQMKSAINPLMNMLLYFPISSFS